MIESKILRWGENPGLSTGALNAITNAAKRGGAEGDSTAQRRKKDVSRGRAWRDVAPSQGMTAAPRNWEEAGKDSPLEPPKETRPVDTVIWDFWPLGL